MPLDLPRIRGDFPSLASGLAFFDSPGGTQTPRVVAEAIAATLSAPLANRGTGNPAQRNAERVVESARSAVADFVAGDPAGVVFGRSATQLTFDFSRTLAAGWRPGDEIVVSRLDHDANIRPWVLAAARAGAAVRWVDFDPTSGELATEAVEAELSERTRLVAVTAASNLLGTMPDVGAISAAAHAVGAVVYVDGVHFAAHELVDVASLGCDFFVCSPYKFLGAHHGVLVAAPDRLESLVPDKLLPGTDQVPERFELGTLPYEVLAGTTAAVDYLAAMAGEYDHRRAGLRAGLAAVAQVHQNLGRRIATGLLDLGADVFSRARRRTSTTLFALPGVPSGVVADELAAVGVNAPAGSFYALEASRHLGLGDHGAVRVGLAPYTDDADVTRLLEALARIRRTR